MATVERKTEGLFVVWVRREDGWWPMGPMPIRDAEAFESARWVHGRDTIRVLAPKTTIEDIVEG
ncbi:hypothetical protein SAMN05421543_1413 [Alicyclobacillus macrosporangiidus]|uniref:Uncharacterized protein n=2 Tax=Alicyclobacillus macrosporangiidus TaxID=392015 RepID=A0A1I7LEK3_9BACL|nr:hypothetical protein SAMN05421543_1413 [Alicyclobacillus macrosporangiidus]